MQVLRDRNTFQRRQPSQLIRLAAATVPLMAYGAAARAADVHWISANGSWDTPANWSSNAVPGATDDTFIDNAAAGSTAHVTAAEPTVSSVIMSNGNTLSIENGGSLNVANTGTITLFGVRIGDGLGVANGAATLLLSGNAQFTTTGSGTILGQSNSMRFGAAAGTAFVIQDGTSNVEGEDINVGQDAGTNSNYQLKNGTVRARGWSFIGKDASNGTFNQSGGTFNAGGQLRVGNSGGNGTLILGGAGVVNANDEMMIGVDGNSVGVVNQNGGTVNVGALVHVGRSGGTGTFNLSGGSFIIGAGRTTGDRDFVVSADAGSHGTMNQTGGTLSSRWSFVGRGGNPNGVYNMSGGTLNTTGWLRVAENGSTGTFNLSGNGVLNLGNGDTDFGDDLLVVGVDANSKGNLNITGGTINLIGLAADLSTGGRMLIGQGGGSGTVTQSAGQVNVILNAAVGTDGPAAGPRGTGTYLISGGTLAVANDLNIGTSNTSTGYMNVGSTAFVRANRLAVARTASAVGTLDQVGGTINAGTNGMQIGALGVYNMSGGTLSVAGAGTNNGLFNYTGGTVAPLPSLVGTGTTTVGTGRTLTVGVIQQPVININGTGKVAINGNNQNSGAGTVNIAAGATLDIGNNVFGYDYTGASPLPAVRAQLVSGRNGGSWNGTGITSSNAASDPQKHTGVGYIESADLGTTTFNGATVDTTTLLLRYTLYGDSNLDRHVDLTDFTYLAANFNKAGGATWLQGDYNYDGNVDLTDFTFLAANFNQTLSSDSGGGLGSPVPEPIGVAVLAAAAAAIGRFRRGRPAR